MPEDRTLASATDALRRRAETRLRERQAQMGQPLTEAETRRLLHELSVHQIELELQNEELQETCAQLERSLERYTDLYDFAPMGYFTLTGDGTIQELNLAGAALLGQERSRLIGRRFGFFVSAETRPAFAAFLDRALAASSKEICEIALAPNGAPLRHLHLECLCEETDPSRRCRIVAMDITGRTRVEQTLRHYERIVAATPDAVALLDRNYVYLAVNDEYSKRTGRPREAIVGYTVGEVMGEEIFQTLVKVKLDRCLAGERVQYQSWFDTVTEGRRFFDVTYALCRDETGADAGIVVSACDVTDLKQAEERLREGEAKLQSIFRAAPIGLGSLVDRVIREVNQTTCQLLGYTREELIGKNARLLYTSQADFDFVGTEKYRQIRDRGVGTVETRWRRKDGTVLDILLSSAAIDPDDLSKGVSFSAMDITERKRAQARLAENAERLQHLSRRLLSVQEEERRALARELHDDFGQQLGALKLNLAMLERDLPDSAHRSRLADCIQIVDYARNHIQNIARRLRPAILDDLGLAAALHWYARGQAERAGCMIDVQDRLPPLLPELETAVFRIVQEAVNNAIRHGEARRIAVAVAVADGELSLAIQDDGAGFDPDAAAEGESGLGLIGMRERAELLGGWFGLASRPGAGTRIEVTIPLEERQS